MTKVAADKRPRKPRVERFTSAEALHRAALKWARDELGYESDAEFEAHVARLKARARPHRPRDDMRAALRTLDTLVAAVQDAATLSETNPHLPRGCIQRMHEELPYLAPLHRGLTALVDASKKGGKHGWEPLTALIAEIGNPLVRRNEKGEWDLVLKDDAEIDEVVACSILAGLLTVADVKEVLRETEGRLSHAIDRQRRRVKLALQRLTGDRWRGPTAVARSRRPKR